MKEQGIENPEDYVLTQYYMSNDPNKIPVPIDVDESQDAGILVLNPDEAEKPFQSGGAYGTVRSVFKALGFMKNKKEVAVSKDVSKRKRTGGLYDDRIR